jgi:hypothetical protein
LGSLFNVRPEVDHVDVYAISVRDRVQRLVARISLESGSFAVHAGGDVEKRILARLESTSMHPQTLDGLGLIFDAPELMASPVHTMAQCPFGCRYELPLEKRRPQLTLI